MNAYEIEQIEKDVRASFRLPLSFEGWAEIERRAREERARVIGEAFRNFFSGLWTRLTRFGRELRGTHAPRLRHN